MLRVLVSAKADLEDVTAGEAPILPNLLTLLTRTAPIIWKKSKVHETTPGSKRPVSPIMVSIPRKKMEPL